MQFKQSFIERYSKITDFNKFKETSLRTPRKSFRVNTLKTSVREIKQKLKYLNLEQIPWCGEGFFVNKKIIGLGNLLEYSLGHIYIQEASSMIPALVLNPGENDLVLDMAASPGSKTTQLACLMNNKGLIIANDVDIKRLKSLSMNIQRCGLTNTIITLQEGRFFKDFKFDKILLDAPCSGTGTISKSESPVKDFSENTIKRLAGTQRQLISTAFENLKDNGTLVYSTCSIDPEENESIINFLLEKYSNARLEKIEIKGLKTSSPILEFNGNKYSSELKNV